MMSDMVFGMVPDLVSKDATFAAAVAFALLAGLLLSGDLITALRKGKLKRMARGGLRDGLADDLTEGSVPRASLRNSDAVEFDEALVRAVYEGPSYWLRQALRRGAPACLMEYASLVSWRLDSKRARSGADGDRPRDADMRRRISTSGFDGRITPSGLASTRLRLTVACGLLGAALGAPLSASLALLLAGLGVISGSRLPHWALNLHVRKRVEQAERHLPEMLDVISLGLRSGLSFDRALDAYCDHFDTLMAWEMAAAKEKWSCGLLSRDEALACVARSIDSPVLKRVTDDIARSLRFGSALSSSLESVAADIRKEYRARKQEEVAKAPVKMMVPTGTLILPAMLILVLGPVMLELIRGF